jgi:hypothetical protein
MTGEYILEYTDKTHEYKVNGEIVPSVTQILTTAGYIDTSFYNKEGSDRGTKIHKATAMLDMDFLSLEDYQASDIFGYLQAWETFKADTGIEIVNIEQPLYSSEHNFAGTPDRIAYWKMGKINRMAILDIKSGAKEKWQKLQLNAYRILTGHDCLMVCVHLKPNGRYSLEQKKKNDEFLSILKAVA